MLRQYADLFYLFLVGVVRSGREAERRDGVGLRSEVVGFAGIGRCDRREHGIEKSEPGTPGSGQEDRR